MEGIIKTVSTPAPAAVKAPIIQEAIGQEAINDVPLFMYQHFGVDAGKADNKTCSELRDIYNEVSSEIPFEYRTPGNVVMKISSLQRRLGQPHITEKPYGKVYQYLMISKSMRDLDKRREALAA